MVEERWDPQRMEIVDEVRRGHSFVMSERNTGHHEPCLCHVPTIVGGHWLLLHHISSPVHRSASTVVHSRAAAGGEEEAGEAAGGDPPGLQSPGLRRGAS